MAEKLCPMCSKPNAEDAEECEFCGARLTPLVLDPEGQPPGEADRRGEAEEGAGETPDWLARIRRRAEDESPPPEDPGQGPDWLNRLRSAEGEEEGPPTGEVPDWLAEEEPPQGDWLDRLRESAGPESSEAPKEEGPSEEERYAAETPEAEATAPEEPTSAERPFAEEPPVSAEEDLPSWLMDETTAPSEEEAGPPAPEADRAVDRPGWFEEFEGAGAGEEERAETEAEVGPQEIEAPTEREEPVTGPPTTEGEAEAATGAAEEAPGEEAGPEGALDWESFDWDSLAEEAAADEPEEPESLGAPPDEEELPHVPALIVDEGEQPSPAEPDEFDLDAIELPDWLSDVGKERAEEPPPEEEAAETGDLAPATIPSWLEAMRPVETFQPVVEIEPEDEQAVESVGPLAGLRGVLLAEPVVAKPRSSTATGAQLQITERQYAQAELLSRIVAEEEKEAHPARRGRRRLPFIRWLVSLALLFSVLLPPLLGLPTFATPERVSRDLGPLIEIVNNVPVERPALLVFDYEPGYTAELEGVAGALLESLMAREVRVVTMSTHPTGPPLALELVDQIGTSHSLDNGRNYLHLGYLSGGPTAVQLFAATPRGAILKGFMLPPEMPGDSAWELPILRGVSVLSDFGMVAVISSGTDSARTWAEQATPWLGDTPLVMVLSTGAEPLIRPYFESLDPQVDGILTGLPAAVAYEQVNGRSGAARGRWDAFGSGALAAEIILAAGMVYGAASWFLRRREEAE